MAEIVFDEFSTERVIFEQKIDEARTDPECDSGIRNTSFAVEQYVVVSIKGVAIEDTKEPFGYGYRLDITQSEPRFRVKLDSYQEGKCGAG